MSVFRCLKHDVPDAGCKVCRLAKRQRPSELAPATGSARRALLNGARGLKDPHWRDMTTEDRLLHACLCAYRKHVSGDDLIGWERLGEILHNAICESIGDDAFVEWNERAKWE